MRICAALTDPREPGPAPAGFLKLQTQGPLVHVAYVRPPSTVTVLSIERGRFDAFINS